MPIPVDRLEYQVCSGLSCACNKDYGQWWVCRSWAKRELFHINLPNDSLRCGIGDIVLSLM
jgi:hypothetical protein